MLASKYIFVKTSSENALLYTEARCKRFILDIVHTTYK
jgi:hypothetical protein